MGRGLGMLLGGFFPWSDPGAGKASQPTHTHTREPPKHGSDPQQQELITGIGN